MGWLRKLPCVDIAELGQPKVPRTRSAKELGRDTPQDRLRNAGLGEFDHQESFWARSLSFSVQWPL